MILVYIPENAASPPQTEALLSACSGIVAPDRCIQANAQESVARILWRSPTSAQVTVELDQQTGQRDLEFLAEDPPDSRWKAVGLVVGALVLELTHEPSSKVPDIGVPPSAQPPPPKTPLAPDTAGAATAKENARPPLPPPGSGKPLRPQAISSPLRWALGGGAIAGTGLSRGPGRLGGFVGLRTLVWRQVGLCAATSLTTLLPSEGLSGSWVTAALGPYLEPRLGHGVTLLLDLHLQLQNWTMHLDATPKATEMSAHRTYLGVGGTAGIAMLLSHHARLILGGALASSPGQQVLMAGAATRTNPKVAASGLLGMEFGRF